MDKDISTLVDILSYSITFFIDSLFKMSKFFHLTFISFVALISVQN